MVFAWAGASDPADFVGARATESWDEDVYPEDANAPGMFTPGEGFVTMAEVTADVELDSEIVVERLLDITERACREPVSVTNRGQSAFASVDGSRLISKALRVGYEPVPQSVVFKPSCVITSTIALKPRLGVETGRPCSSNSCTCACPPNRARRACSSAWRLISCQRARRTPRVTYGKI